MVFKEAAGYVSMVGSGGHTWQWSFPLHCDRVKGSLHLHHLTREREKPYPSHKIIKELTLSCHIIFARWRCSDSAREEGPRANSHFFPPHLLGTGSLLLSKDLHVFFLTTAMARKSGNKCHKLGSWSRE